jgi:DNA adenine methylase
MSTEPILKWAGGKRWLAARVVDLFVESGAERLVEPFVGGGAVFFAIAPDRALLSDNNADLIECYTQVRDRPRDLAAALAEIPLEEATYYRIRAEVPSAAFERAVRFLYLNRTAFNGLYRVNAQGRFNVPYGCKPGTKVLDVEQLVATSVALRSAGLAAKDFRSVLRDCGEGDFVYLDPPYTVRHNQNGFNRYNQRLFSWDDQTALAALAQQAVERGATVAISNADHESIRELYAPFDFVYQRVDRLTRMAASARHRGRTSELLLVGAHPVLQQ